jgi:hypothetical protein
MILRAARPFIDQATSMSVGAAAILFTRPAVTDAAVIAAHQPDGEEYPHAFVVTTPGASVTGADDPRLRRRSVAPHREILHPTRGAPMCRWIPSCCAVGPSGTSCPTRSDAGHATARSRDGVRSRRRPGSSGRRSHRPRTPFCCYNARATAALLGPYTPSTSMDRPTTSIRACHVRTSLPCMSLVPPTYEPLQWNDCVRLVAWLDVVRP